MTAVERYEPSPIERLNNETVKGIANTDLIPKPLRNNVPAIIATILKGRALGLDDMHALTAIHFIQGKPTLAAETMVMLARRAGHSIAGDFGDGAVTVRGKRADTGDEMTVTWTMQMAERAQLIGKDNWKAYPESMLWARAASQLCRMLFADVLAGVGYTAEELERSPEQEVSDAISTATIPDADGTPNDSIEDADFVAVEDSAAEPDGPDRAEGASTPEDSPQAEPGLPVDERVVPSSSAAEEEPVPPVGADGSPQAGSDAVSAKPASDPAPGEQAEMSFADKARVAQERVARKQGPSE